MPKGRARLARPETYSFAGFHNPPLISHEPCCIAHRQECRCHTILVATGPTTPRLSSWRKQNVLRRSAQDDRTWEFELWKESLKRLKRKRYATAERAG